MSNNMRKPRPGVVRIPEGQFVDIVCEVAMRVLNEASKEELGLYIAQNLGLQTQIELGVFVHPEIEGRYNYRKVEGFKKGQMTDEEAAKVEEFLKNNNL